MDLSVECTHCRVLMTSWSAPGSPVRYYQCPFCGHTHSLAYAEVFRRRAGARLVGREPAPARPPAPSADELRWRLLKSRAVRWFARLEDEERRVSAYAAAGARARGRSR